MEENRYYTITPHPTETYGRAIDLRRVSIGINGADDMVTITLPIVYSQTVKEKDHPIAYVEEDITQMVPSRVVTLVANNDTKVKANGTPYLPKEIVPQDAMGEFDFFYALISGDVPVKIRTMTIQKIEYALAMGRLNVE